MQTKLITSATVAAVGSSVACAEGAAEMAITQADIQEAQKNWGAAIVAIGEAYSREQDYAAVAENTVDTMYGYGQGAVLFKPTKAAEKQFRSTREEALSYFVKGAVPEDGGFALQPWSKVRFENTGFILDGGSAVAMGNYYFTDAATGEEVKVEFTFGYFRDAKGKLRINLHHSSLPYSPAR